MKFLAFFLTIFIFFIALNANEVKQRNFPEFKGIISAFGDFNSDKFTDIFLIKNNSYCLQIVRQLSGKTENDQQIFIEENNLRYCLSSDDQIVNLIPSDFDGDAVMDLAIVIKKEKYYEVTIIKGDKDKFDEVLLEKTGKLLNQPLLLDINGDMISDLLVLAEDESSQPKYYIYKGGKNITKELFIDRANIKFADPNSNAFIDLNRDGVSDIFLEEQNQMFYYFAGTNGYKEFKEIKYPKNKIIGSSSFCDINSDEKIDHIIPVCENEGQPPCSIIIYDSEKNDWITLIDEIKVGNDEFYFEKPEVTFENGNKIKIPIRLRHGYVNENGYTDLMALMKRKSDKKDDWHIVLFNNRKNKIKSEEQKFYFEISALNETMDVNPILVTFFDLYEDGVIDILVNFENFKTNSANYEFKTLTLNNFADVNFIKVLVTSGLCNNEKCFEKKVYGENSYLAYGTNNPGPMVCYQLMNSYNHVMKSCGGQLSQSSDFALQMPYTIFGLGLYANYIEKLKAVIPSGNTSIILQKKVEQIVPDSQIVIIPNPLNDPSLWKVKLFLTPSDIIYKTLYTLTGICVILIVIIGFLHRKEMLEDVKEQAEFKKQWPEIRR